MRGDRLGFWTGNQRLNIASSSACVRCAGRPTIRATALPWTLRRPSIGIVWPPNKDRRKPLSNLGFMYQNGQGVARDPGQAVEWWRRAALGGNSSALFNLAVAYFNGDGVMADDVEAYKWVELAEAPCAGRAPAQVRRVA